jgi:hypothetical protein
MNRSFPIQLKAAFLLAVFSLSTVIGFACGIGIDMGFNKTHHQGEEATEIHVHKDGKKHHHKKTGHTHDSKKDDCCSDKVVKVAQADKAVTQTVKYSSPVFFTAFLIAYHNTGIFFPSPISTFHKYFVRGHHPPISDIRIAIQSFQI